MKSLACSAGCSGRCDVSRLRLIEVVDEGSCETSRLRSASSEILAKEK